MRAYWVVAGTDIHHQILTGGHFVTGGELFWGAHCKRGHFVSGSFCPRWLIDLMDNGQVAFIRVRFAGAFDLLTQNSTYLCSFRFFITLVFVHSVKK